MGYNHYLSLVGNFGCVRQYSLALNLINMYNSVIIEFQIVNTRMGELYFALPNPPAFSPDINYFATIMKSGAKRYYTVSIGETLR